MLWVAHRGSHSLYNTGVPTMSNPRVSDSVAPIQHRSLDLRSEAEILECSSVYPNDWQEHQH